MKNNRFLRSVWFVLALVLVLGVTASIAPAASAETYGDWTYSVSGGTAIVTGYTGTEADVSVPTSFGSYTVTQIGSNALKGNTVIRSITFPDTLLTIGESAFADCVNLEEVTLPKKLTNLGNYSFSNCTGLSKLVIQSVAINDKDDYRDEPFYNAGSGTDGIEVIFDDGCTKVPAYLFYPYSGSSTAPNLKSVTLADSVTTIKRSAFEGCTTLSELNFGSGLTTIGYGAFSGCSSLETFTLPAAVTTIDSYAFYKTGLTGFDLSASLTTIGEYAFADCVNLEEVTLPKKLTNLGNYSFSNCTSLGKIVVNSYALNDKDDYRDEPFYNAGSATDGIEVIFADGCTKVPGHLFYAYSGGSTAANIKTVTLADSVTTINTRAFEGCTTIKTVNFGSGLTTIGYGAFSGCTGLKTFTLPAAVTTVDSYAFYKSGVTGFDLSASLITIGEYAFGECVNLTEVTLPKKLTNLGNYAFSNCTSLGKIVVNSYALNNKDDYRDEPFYNAGSATDGIKVIFADGCTKVPAYLFYPYSGGSTAANIKTVTLADSVTTINTSAFEGCTTLSTVNFGTGLTTVGYGAFAGCTGLKNVVLPSAVTTVDGWAFGNSGLTSITLPDSLITIGNNAFEGCNGLTEITLPKKLTNLGNYAFKNCTNLADITILSAKINNKDDYQDEPFYNVGSATEGVTVTFAEGCTRVPSNLFYAYSGASAAANLRNVILSDTVTSIGDSAFENCSVLDNVVIGKGVTSIEKETFKNCTGLKAITIKHYVTDMGSNVFSGCENTVTIYGYYETAAHAHAVEYGINFVALEDPLPENPFVDVHEDSWFRKYVLWAVGEGITTGTTPTTFEPDATCTRGQVVTFLWRAAGEPAPASSNNPFADVKPEDYFYTAVLWAAGEGITTGTTSTAFSPEEPCTRGQVVTFLWRYADEPYPSTSNNPFEDVKPLYYYNAVLWAVGKNITTGVTSTTFEPESTCSRAQIVTFLYRHVTGRK